MWIISQFKIIFEVSNERNEANMTAYVTVSCGDVYQPIKDKLKPVKWTMLSNRGYWKSFIRS